MRTLYYVPVVHALCETGMRGAKYVLAIEQLLGSHGAARHLDALDEFWRTMPPLVLEHLELCETPWNRIHVFADSIPRPLAGDPDVLVAEWVIRFMAAGSPLAQFILNLVERGATVHGTEDDLLVEKHGQHLLHATGEEKAEEHHATGRRYIGLRDACIAMHINRFVPQGHTAVLFMGAMHSVDELLGLEPDWHIERIDLMDTDLLPLAR